MTTCKDRPTQAQQDAANVLQEKIDQLMIEYFKTKFADYWCRQVQIAKQQGRDFDMGHFEAVALHLYEAGLELGSLLQAFGVSVKVGDTVRDGTDETLTYCDPDGPMRCLVAGDAPTWMNPEFESEFCKVMINTLQVFLPKATTPTGEAEDGE